MSRMNRGVKLFVVFLIPLVILSNISLVLNDKIIAYSKFNNIINNDYVVAGIAISGMTKEEAMDKIEATLVGVDNKDIVIKNNDDEWLIPVKNLNLKYNVPQTIENVLLLTQTSSRNVLPLSYEYNTAYLSEQIEKIASLVYVPAVKAEVTQFANKIEKTYEQNGKLLDKDKLITAVQDLLANGLVTNEIDVFILEQPPNIVFNDIKEIDKHFVNFSTNITLDESDRIQNIKRAIELIDAVVIRPGEVFSYNELVAPYTLDNGYKMAPVIANNSVTDGIGGGVCQVSSTIFVAAMQSGMDIVEHHNHDMPIGYLPLGYDATVSELNQDLKLKNNNTKNMYLKVSYDNYKIHVDIYGNETDYIKYTLETKNNRYNSEKVIELYRNWREGNKHQQELLKEYKYNSQQNETTDNSQSQSGQLG